MRGNDEWGSDREVYSPQEVESVLKALGVEVMQETENDFVSLCPFHGNTQTPAFSTSKVYGYSYCFNPSCAIGSEHRLTLESLARRLRGGSKVSAKGFVRRHRMDIPFEERFESIEEPEAVPFPQEAIEKMHDRLLQTPKATSYLQSRGLNEDTMGHFRVGFTPASAGPVYRPCDMVVVPAYDHKGMPVGIVGRGIEEKVFKNYGPLDGGKGFKKSQIVWNLNNARRHPVLIINEATFDSMRVHQAGYPNVGALLGGSLSKYQTQLISRHFEGVIIFTDNDVSYPVNCRKCLGRGFDFCQGHRPGRELGMQIADALPRLDIKWAAFDDREIYPRGVKDAADMVDDEIRQCIRNAVSHWDYLDWVS